MATNHLLHRETAAFSQQAQFRADTQVVPDRQDVALPTASRIRRQIDQRFGDQFARLRRTQQRQIVMHHQRRIGRHQIDQLCTKRRAQALAGGEHPRHVGFGDFIEQTQHQAIQRHHFNPWIHDALDCCKAWRMRRTAATELALSPWTHKVLARRIKALPSLALSSPPRAMVNACSMIFSAS